MTGGITATHVLFLLFPSFSLRYSGCGLNDFPETAADSLSIPSVKYDMQNRCQAYEMELSYCCKLTELLVVL